VRSSAAKAGRPGSYGSETVTSVRPARASSRRHWPTVPGFEFAGDAIGCVPPAQVGVPEPEPVELGSIRAVELGEVAVEVVRVEQTGLELGDSRPERVGEAGEPCRSVEVSQPRRRHDPAQEQGPLCVSRDRPCAAVTAGDPFEQVVERADRAAEQRTTAPEQVAFHPLDVRAVRHDQDRLAGDIREVPLEK
jgi:hypothetical protein